MHHFWAQNGSFAPLPKKKEWFCTNHYYYFCLPIGTFHCAKFKKILTADPELWQCTIFGPKMVHLPPIFFFGKLLISFWSTYQPLSLCKILKNSTSRSRVMRIHNFWAKMAYFPKWEFFSENLLTSLVSFMHAYLHAKNQSQILIC